MTKNEQRRFCSSICNDLKKEILKRVKTVPENWDGFELRQWIADYYISHYAYQNLKGQRKKDYKNDLIVKNLY